MSFELVKEKIILDQKIGEETTQIMVEGDIIVPDIKPDISKILQTNGKILLDNIDIGVDKVNFTGKIEFAILYLADGVDKPLHSMTSSLDINDFINIDGVNKDINVDMNCEIIHLDCKLLNGRKLFIKTVVEIDAKAISPIISQVVTDITGLNEIQLQKSSLNLSRTVENKEDKIVIKDEVSVPSGKSNIREILFCNVSISDKECRILDGKVTVKGTLLLSTLYKGEIDEDTIEFMEHEIPFNGNIEALDCTENMIGDVDLSVQNQYIQVRPDFDGEERVLEIELSIAAKLNIVSTDEIQVVDDAYCINKELILDREKIKYPNIVCKNKNQSSVKETVILDKAAPEIMQIYNVSGRAKIDDIKIIDDKVIAEGIITANILYVAKSDESPLYCYESVIPFKQTIETRGSRIDMNVDIDLTIEHISFNMLSTNEVEVRFILNFNTQVTGEKEVELLTDATLQELDKDINTASMTIYICQNGDTLWKIAKKYNTSMDEIAELNDIENSTKLFSGQKLLILKKVILN